MINVDKLRNALVEAGKERRECSEKAKKLESDGQIFRADMTAMDADFAADDRLNYAARLLTIVSRKEEIEAFEKRREIQLDVMIYDIPADGDLEEWWRFINDETEAAPRPSWRRSS